MLFLITAVLLLAKEEAPGVQHDEAWRSVQRDWPLLTTADSLLGLQAIFRALLLGSACIRWLRHRSSPLAAEPAMLMLFAAFARVILLIVSPADVYHLEGPLGGNFNITLEVSCLLFLLPLSSDMLAQGFARSAALSVITLLAMATAAANHFAISGEGGGRLDQLFFFGAAFGAGSFCRLLRARC